MKKIIYRLECLLLMTWLSCSVWTGYLLVPILFRQLSKVTAGNLAGDFFVFINYLGLIAVIGLLILGLLGEGVRFFKDRRILWLILAFLGICLQKWCVTPVIVALKTSAHHWLMNYFGSGFGAWHGVSQVLYLAVIVCAFAFFWRWSAR